MIRHWWQVARRRAPRQDWRVRRGHCSGFVVALAVGLGGMAISVILFFALRQREFQLAEARFRMEAKERVEAVERAMADRLVTIRMLQAFYRGSEVVERDEFRQFTAPLLETRDNGVRALFWSPRVTAAQRQAHEQATQAVGLGNYRIVQRDAEGRVQPAGQRDVYWPIFYIEPFSEYRNAWGLDLGQELVGAEVFERVIERGGPTAAFCVPLDSERSAPCSFCVLAPVFAPNGKTRSGLDEVMGFVGGVFRLGMIPRDALISRFKPGYCVAVYAETRPGKFSRMIEISGGSESNPEATEPGNLKDRFARSDSIRYQRQFELAGTQWRVVCVPEEEQYIESRRTWLPLGVLLTGFLLSGLLVGYLLLLGGHTGRIERLVAQRSAELKTISDAALDGVIMMDSMGCVAHWNPAAERIFGYSREEVLGRAIHELLVPPRYRQQARRGLVEFFRTGRGPVVGKVQELQAMRKDGTEFPMEISVSAIRMRNQWWAVAVVRDVSERHRAAEQLLREQRLLREMLNLQERERRLVAYEIHDGLAQMLTGAQFKLQTVQERLQRQTLEDPETRKIFEQGLQLLNDGLVEARRLISGLRPPILDDSGVVAAIHYLAEETRERGGPEVEFVPDVHFQRLAPPLESALFRIVQETLNNACRHSHSLKVRIE